MKKILIIILLLSSLNVLSQNLKFSDIFTYQEQIYNLYSQTPKPILDIIDTLLNKGYIVIESTNESNNLSGAVKKGSTFKLKNIINESINETITFSTIEMTAVNYETQSFITRVETTDFNQYLQWYKDIKNSPNFILQTRSDGMYTFIQNVNKTKLFLHPEFIINNSSIKIKEPIVYVYEFTLTN